MLFSAFLPVEYGEIAEKKWLWESFFKFSSYNFKFYVRSNLVSYGQDFLWKAMRCFLLKFSKPLKLFIFDKQTLFIMNKCCSYVYKPWCDSQDLEHSMCN